GGAGTRSWLASLKGKFDFKDDCARRRARLGLARTVGRTEDFGLADAGEPGQGHAQGVDLLIACGRSAEPAAVGVEAQAVKADVEGARYGGVHVLQQMEGREGGVVFPAAAQSGNAVFEDAF